MGPPASHRISRVPRYSGTPCRSSPSPTRLSRPSAPLSNGFGSAIVELWKPSTPSVRRPSVWPLPSSLATTEGIEFSFFSSGYLDVSLPRVPLMHLWIQCMMTGHYSGRVSPFGHLRLTAYLRLPAAFRSLSRPSSAISAMASTLRSCSLDLVAAYRFLLRLLRNDMLWLVSFLLVSSFRFFLCSFQGAFEGSFDPSKRYSNCKSENFQFVCPFGLCAFALYLHPFSFEPGCLDLGIQAPYSGSCVLPRKEVIQPHLPIRLPCYDFTPVIGLTFDGCFLAVGSPASGAPNSHGVTGGVYKARERIHRGILIRDY